MILKAKNDLLIYDDYMASENVSLKDHQIWKKFRERFEFSEANKPRKKVCLYGGMSHHELEFDEKNFESGYFHQYPSEFHRSDYLLADLDLYGYSEAVPFGFSSEQMGGFADNIRSILKQTTEFDRSQGKLPRNWKYELPDIRQLLSEPVWLKSRRLRECREICRNGPKDWTVVTLETKAELAFYFRRIVVFDEKASYE